MKICYYKINDGCYTWADGDHGDAIADEKCIMAVALGKNVDGNDLSRLQENGTLDIGERMAIGNFDLSNGTIEDKKVIKEIAKRHQVKLVKEEKK